ncbi:hypothetical protein Tco_1182387 [Tanacetum coccineum]
MCTYLKNMEGYKLKDLKLKEFDSIEEMFDRAFKRVNTFEDFRTELVDGKEKRAGEELVQESTKKQKVDDDKEQRLFNLSQSKQTELLGSDQFTLYLSQANSQRADERAPSSLIPENIFRAVITKRLASLTGSSMELELGWGINHSTSCGPIEMLPCRTQQVSWTDLVTDEEEVTIDAIPLAVKSPRIVDWKIHKEGKKSYYQIIRADGKSQMYMVFSHMLKSFDREDLEDLYKLVKARYGSTRPVESMDYLLWNDMKIMFEPHVEDAVWRNQQGYKVLEWKLYDSCGVHSLMMQSMQIYMLVEKKYPLTPPTLSMMLEKKLQIDYESEMAYQLCKLIIKQLKNLLDAVRITAAQVYVNTALMKLVLLMNFKENMLKSCLPLLLNKLNLILNLFPKRKDLRLENETKDSILERSKENPHFKSFWMLLLSLHATLRFSSLQMFQKFTCINSGILFTSMTLSTDSKWTKERDSNSIWKYLEISLLEIIFELIRQNKNETRWKQEGPKLLL